MAGEELLNPTAIASLAGTFLSAILSLGIAVLIGKPASSADKYTLVWLIWDAMIHFVLEGSFVYISLTGTVDNSTHILADTWKEYAKADRRWGVSDPNIVSLEMLTVGLDGPLCLLLIWAIVKHKYYRHWVQIVLCVCELYGGWMTFCPDWLIGSPNLSTGNWLYLWVYLVFFNGLWVVIPVILLYQSWVAMREAFETESSTRSPNKRGGGDAASPNKYNLRSKKKNM